MEEEKAQYGDLTDKEFYEFLNEIEDENTSLEEATLEANEKIMLEEEHSTLVETPENAEIEAYYGDDAWRKLHKDSVCALSPDVKRKAIENSIVAKKAVSQKLKEDRIRIQRMAFDQDNINLSSEIRKEEIRMLISLLVIEHTNMINKYTNFINNRLAKLLSPFIPKKLRMCRIAFPMSVRQCPGFLYKASKEYGEGLSFWAMPNIPYYFEQGTEQSIIEKHHPTWCFSIDKAIASRNQHVKKREKKEIKYASILLQKGVKTYFDLLQLNPFWFETLYNEITK